MSPDIQSSIDHRMVLHPHSQHAVSQQSQPQQQQSHHVYNALVSSNPSAMPSPNSIYDDVFLRPGPVSLPSWEDIAKIEPSPSDVFGDFTSLAGSSANNLPSLLDDIQHTQASHQQVQQLHQSHQHLQQQHFLIQNMHYSHTTPPPTLSLDHVGHGQGQPPPPSQQQQHQINTSVHQYRYSNLKMAYTNSPRVYIPPTPPSSDPGK
ncbi:unnamed protein product, partial [Allacma fusca]